MGILSGSAYDVVIAGGGLAGLTLARHLKLEIPELSIAVLDRLARPLPEAAFKVGESTVELGTHYYGQVLQLHNYFDQKHLYKLGLRFFMGKSHGPIEERPEMGISLFPPMPSYQIDRGLLENDLRQIVEEMGVSLFEGVVVDDILLAKGDERHAISFRHKEGQEKSILNGRWVVDATGRRRLLQTKLGLHRPVEHRASAAWWRYEGRVDVDDLASGPAAEKWRKSIIDQRYYSTNHLTDSGYWVWLIPLGTGATSVGIVTDETAHPLSAYGRSYESALHWLREHEPVLWQYLRDRDPLDFHSLKNFSYTSAQVFSHQRWGCAGEAGVFLDPLYSPGSDFIALGNTMLVELIRRERASALTRETVETFNRLFLDILFPLGLAYYQGAYASLGHAQIFTVKLVWDTAVNWAYIYPLYFHALLKSPTEEIFELGRRYQELNQRVQQLFIDWAGRAPARPLPMRGDMARMTFLQLLHAEMATHRSDEQVLEIMRKNLDRFEELSQSIFWQAVKECYPDNPALKKRPWINAWRMNLHPDTWAEQGLFEAESAPRPLAPMQGNFTGVFDTPGLRQHLRYELPYRIMHWNRGFVMRHIVGAIFRRFIAGKPALWLRKVLVRDFRT